MLPAASTSPAASTDRGVFRAAPLSHTSTFCVAVSCAPGILRNHGTSAADIVRNRGTVRVPKVLVQQCSCEFKADSPSY